MPTVGKQHFAYTPAGKAAAKKASKKSGMPMKMHYDMATQTNRPAKPNPKAPLGEGGRFAALKNKLANRPGVTNPGALAASIGRKKYGAKKFAALSAGGR